MRSSRESFSDDRWLLGIALFLVRAATSVLCASRVKHACMHWAPLEVSVSGVYCPYWRPC